MGPVKASVGANARANGIFTLLFRQIALVGSAMFLLWLMKDQFADLNIGTIFSSVGDVVWHQWLLAAIATGASFLAIAHYDRIVHRLAGTQVSDNLAKTSGASAVAIAQFAGFGVLTAALVRWRMVPSLSLLAALRISAIVSASFMIGWAFIAALSQLFFGGIGPMPNALPVLVLLAVAVLALAPIVRQNLPSWVPSLLAFTHLACIVLIDLGFAALAFYALLPDPMVLNFGTFFTVFLLAVMAGLVCGTPGGVGAFELILIANIHVISAEQLLGAAVAFRLVYHLLPAFVGALGFGVAALVIGRMASRNVPDIHVMKPRRTQIAVHNDDWAEAKLAHNSSFNMLNINQKTAALVATTTQAHVMLGHAIGQADHEATLRKLQSTAKAAQKWPALYKVDAKLAATARRIGWAVSPVASEAWIDPLNYEIEHRARRQLRRKLRHAEKAGVKIVAATDRLPLVDMARVANEWRATHGDERGFSMGKFDQDHISRQRIYLAYQQDALVAFITMHEVANEWTLDLMRHVNSPPDGAMHSLIHTAITQAKAVRLPRISLAAVPCQRDLDVPVVGKPLSTLLNRMSGNGLRQFKSSFAPTWTTRYMATPSWFSMPFIAADLYFRITTSNRS